VLLWFVGGAALIVWQVFGDPTIDYRLVALGAVLPDLLDAPFGGARVAHGVLASVALLTIVVLATIGRRAARRRWLALPIGTFLHLVLDGAWATTTLFWWPLGGTSFGDHPLPSLERGGWSVAMEVVGALELAWLWQRFGFADARRRATFARTGRLDPSALP
jgi:hypothetical protein